MEDARSNATRTVEALEAGRLSVGVWGCGHIGASAMYHFSRKGVQCVGYDIAESRVQEILDGRFLATDQA
jgi:UDP-N-acetyl-D-mannosaminuronate dehydrogenase